MAHTAPAPVHTQHEHRSGWLTFAAVLFFAAAAANAVYGFAALLNDGYFQIDELLFGDLSMWGAIYLTIAALQVTAGALILRRSTAGAVLGVLLALGSGTVALLSMGAYPVWSVVVLVLDGLIIYGLTVHGPSEEW